MNRYFLAIALLITLLGCKERTLPKPTVAQRAEVKSVEPDAANLIKGNIAPNPQVSGNRITRAQITDPEEIFRLVQRALDAAPPWAQGDQAALKSHSQFVSDALDKALPLHGDHLIELQCGQGGQFNQSFLQYDLLTHRLEVTLPQLHEADIKGAKGFDKLLMITMSDYFGRTLSLKTQIPDMHIPGSSDLDIFLPLQEPLEEAEKKLSEEGSSLYYSSDHRIILVNSPFNSGSLRTELAMQKIINAYLRAMLSGGYDRRELDAEFEKERTFWDSFPNGMNASNWYGEVLLQKSPQDVCLLVRLRDIYPPIARPNKLLNLVFGEKNGTDLTADAVSWYVITRQSGEIVATGIL